MSRISDALKADHDRIDAILGEAVVAARSANWHVYQRRFDALSAALLEHIAYEEHELFPQLARLLGSKTLVEALRREHRNLCAGLEKLGATEPASDPEGWLAHLDQIAVLLREHHANELRICYPEIDRLAFRAAADSGR